MSRAYCYQCHRAKITCLCGRIEKQANSLKVVVLQHPEETSNPKGSAIIAELGLQQYQRWAGEDFREHKGLSHLLAEEAGKVVLLYPSESSTELNEQWLKKRTNNISTLLVIDGSWRKAKKIYGINTQLHDLPTVRLAKGLESVYRIRKQPQTGYLSTIECVVEALRVLEAKPVAYQSMIDLFVEMIDFQIVKMGEKTYSENYQGKNK